MNLNLSLLIFIIFLFITCKKDEKIPEPVTPVPAQPVTLNEYPMSAGIQWRYYTESNINLQDTSFTNKYSSIWTVIGDTSINGILSYKIEQKDSNYNGNINNNITYYANLVDGFYGMAVDGFGQLLDLRTRGFVYPVDESILIHSPDTLFIPDNPIRFLKFPSILNDQWIVLEYNSTFHKKREYLNYETVFTPAGVFSTVKLKSFTVANNQPDTNFVIYQYVSDKGIVREERLFHVIGPAGPGTVKQTSTLTFINF